jgi:fructose-1,6-bisphosphatase I
VFFPEKESSWELSYNASNVPTFAKPVQDWLAAHAPIYNYRYAGSLAVDFHRLLSNGGMFLYPAIVNHQTPGKNRPQGKLRLLYEANVVAFIAREAGGAAVDEKGNDILGIPPQHRHQRTALYVGNKEIVDKVSKSLKRL